MRDEQPAEQRQPQNGQQAASSGAPAACDTSTLVGTIMINAHPAARADAVANRLLPPRPVVLEMSRRRARRRRGNPCAMGARYSPRSHVWAACLRRVGQEVPQAGRQVLYLRRSGDVEATLACGNRRSCDGLVMWPMSMSSLPRLCVRVNANL